MWCAGFRIASLAPETVRDAEEGKSVADVGAGWSVLASELAARKFSLYAQRRLSGRSRSKTSRPRVDLEMAYNPNDCVELRWGAPDKSEEGIHVQAASAVGAARENGECRAWFHERRRPPRAAG
jgi:hypothetical protein